MSPAKSRAQSTHAGKRLVAGVVGLVVIVRIDRLLRAIQAFGGVIAHLIAGRVDEAFDWEGGEPAKPE